MYVRREKGANSTARPPLVDYRRQVSNDSSQTREMLGSPVESPVRFLKLDKQTWAMNL